MELKDAVSQGGSRRRRDRTGAAPDDANRAIGAPGSEWKSATEKRIPRRRPARASREPPEPCRERRSDDRSSFAEDLASRGSLLASRRRRRSTRSRCVTASADAATGHDRLARYLRLTSGGTGRRTARAARAAAGAGELPQAFARSAAVAGMPSTPSVSACDPLDPPRSRGGGRKGVGRKAGSRGADVLASPGCSPPKKRLRCRALAMSADAWPDAIGRSADARARGPSARHRLAADSVRVARDVDRRRPRHAGDEDENEKSHGPDRVSPELVVFPPIRTSSFGERLRERLRVRLRETTSRRG